MSNSTLTIAEEVEAKGLVAVGERIDKEVADYMEALKVKFPDCEPDPEYGYTDNDCCDCSASSLAEIAKDLTENPGDESDDED